jgi:bacillithiol system protein YtxJ
MPILWNLLKEETQLEQIVRDSYQSPQLIFKHSTRCSLSGLAKGRMEKNELPPPLTCHLLDLIAHRSLSNTVAEKFHVHHESPQVLLLHNGECVYDESHLAIETDEIIQQLRMLEKQAL